MQKYYYNRFNTNELCYYATKQGTIVYLVCLTQTTEPCDKLNLS